MMFTLADMLTAVQRKRLAGIGAKRKKEGDRIQVNLEAGERAQGAPSTPGGRGSGRVNADNQENTKERRSTMKGRVKFFNQLKGWGFIVAEDGREFFVHWRSIVGAGRRSLEAEQDVAFEVEETPDGRTRAVYVQVLQSADSAEYEERESAAK